MSPDSIHFETVDLIRQITSDGKLEHSEVWDLAEQPPVADHPGCV